MMILWSPGQGMCALACAMGHGVSNGGLSTPVGPLAMTVWSLGQQQHWWGTAGSWWQPEVLGTEVVLGPTGPSSLAGCVWSDPMGPILADSNALAAATMAGRRHEDGAGLSAHGPRGPRWDGPRWDPDCAVSQNKTRDGTIHIY